MTLHNNEFEFSVNSIDRIGEFEEIVDTASQEGFIFDVPGSESETYHYASQSVRLQTISERLYLLGYFHRRIPNSKISLETKRLKNAIKLFQEEAGLTTDKWVGDKTWFALDELVSFESELSETWFENDEIKPTKSVALHRAIQLRLWSLGLYKNKPNPNFNFLKSGAFQNFRFVLKALAIANAQFVGINAYTCKILFNQDLITKRISLRSHKSKNTLFRYNVTPKELSKKGALIEKFLINVAKVELWLLGHKSKINGRNDFNPRSDNQLYMNLISFYTNFMKFPESKAKAHSKKLRPSFFKAISLDPVSSNEIDIPTDEIYQFVSNPNKLEEAWSYIKNQGTRLWDGMKRIWRWVLIKGKKALHYLKENIFKGFFRYIQKAYKILKVGISSIGESLGNYIVGGMKEQNTVILYQKDMDSILFINKTSTNSELIEVNKRIIKNSKAFLIGCQIFSFVLKTLISIAMGVFGWFKFLLSLLKSYKDLFTLYKDFKSLSTLN